GFALALGTGQNLLADKWLQCWLRGDFAAELHTVNQRLEIVVARKEIELDRRRRERVGAFDAHPPAALGTQMHWAECEGGKRVRFDPTTQPFDRAPAGHVDL